MNNNKEVTIYDIAKELSISPSTVSRGLKNHPHIKKETIKRIKELAHEMGYQRNKLASDLRLKQSHTIGLIVPKLNSVFMATVIAGIEKVTNKFGYGLLISQSQESEIHEKSCVNTLFNSRIDGLLISFSYNTKSIDYLTPLLKKNIPVVFFDRVIECDGCTSVVIDNFKAGYEATAHLIDQGCKRIVHLSGNMLRNVYRDRFDGYKKALSDKGIMFDDSLVIVSDLSGPSTKDIISKILRMKPLPDGIFTSNDTSAVNAIVELKKAGIRIPEDIAIVGFNDEPFSKIVEPNLTTVNYPAMKMGEIAASSLIGRLKNTQPDDKRQIILEHNLVIRESSLRSNCGK
jgi:LacI family transcriptional regulator